MPKVRVVVIVVCRSRMVMNGVTYLAWLMSGVGGNGDVHEGMK